MVLNVNNQHYGANEQLKAFTDSDENLSEVLHNFLSLTSQVLGIPGAFISIMDDEQQTIRASRNFSLQQSSRAESFCRYVLENNAAVVINDTLMDSRFCIHPLVTGEPFIRFYAGVPLKNNKSGIPGTLCVTDTHPHSFTVGQLDTLTTLSALMITFIESWHFAGFIDPVTKLPNRQRLIHDLQKINESGGTCSRRLILIDCIDMPRAYELARSMGMPPVESLLKDMASLLTEQFQADVIGPVYTVATGRFALIVPKQSLLTAARVATGLTGITADLGDEVSVDLTPYTGETVFTPNQDAPQEILRQAVSALHEAISRDIPARTFESMQDNQRTNDFTLMNDLSIALRQNNELFLVYQPKICLQTGKPVGLEALTRWNHPLRGELPPSVFIPLAAQTSLLSRLTTWVIDTSISWIKSLPPGLRIPVTINISEKDFSDEHFADQLEEKMLNAGLPTRLLGIECLETERIIESQNALNGLEMLKLRGFSISLDDFGTGYSNISYLRHMPLDVIKLDKSLIDELTTNKASQIIIHNIIIMLKQLDYIVLAEGVEDKETLDMLKLYGCDQVQGYFYTKPLISEAIERWLKLQE